MNRVDLFRYFTMYFFATVLSTIEFLGRETHLTGAIKKQFDVVLTVHFPVGQLRM